MNLGLSQELHTGGAHVQSGLAMDAGLLVYKHLLT